MTRASTLTASALLIVALAGQAFGSSERGVVGGVEGPYGKSAVQASLDAENGSTGQEVGLTATPRSDTYDAKGGDARGLFTQTRVTSGRADGNERVSKVGRRPAGRSHSIAYYKQALRGQVAAKRAAQRKAKRLVLRVSRLRFELRETRRMLRGSRRDRGELARRLSSSTQIARLNSDIGYAIDYVFGPKEAPGAKVVAQCESTYQDIGLAALRADNGQGYYGIFQMGDPGKWELREYAFWRYETVLDQVLAAYRMWAHRGWSAWQCRPEGGLRW